MSSTQNALRLAALAAVWLVTAGVDSCSSQAGGPTFVTDLKLKNAAGAVTQEFAAGAPITMELSVRNRRNTEALLQFTTGHQSDFVVVDDGTNRVRWKWSTGKAFFQGTSEVAFDAGETRIFTVEWNQVDGDGQQVAAGNYEARGALLFAEFATDPLAPNQLGSPVRALIIRQAMR